MLTHNSALLPTLTGDWKVDGPKLLNALHRLFLALNSPHALKITEAQLENVTIDDSSLTSVSSLNMAGTLDLDGNPLAIDADADTYLYTSADDVVRLAVAGSDHTIWNTTGLGIGVVPGFAFHLQNSTPVALVDAAAGGANFSLRRCNTSYASPSALADNDLIGVVAWRGHDGSAYSAAQARISGVASGAWTGSSRGTYINFDMTPSGSTTMATKFTFSAAGTMYAGDGAAALPAYSFASSGNSDCGLFLSSNKPAISTNGTQVCLFDTDRLTLAAGYHVTSATATGTTPAIQSGTYTPTLTNTTNITSSTSNADVRWVRVGNVVKVSGYVNARPTAAGACVLDLSIPIASSLAAATELTGVCHLSTDAGGYIYGDTTNDRATLSFTSGAAYPVEAPVAFEFSYEVL